MRARHRWLKPVIIATWEAEIRKVHSLRPAQAKSSQDPISKNNQSKMDWRYGSGSRVHALQMQSLEFKPHTHQKKKKGNRKISG
jgi:hypothetical protein